MNIPSLIIYMFFTSAKFNKVYWILFLPFMYVPDITSSFWKQVLCSTEPYPFIFLLPSLIEVFTFETPVIRPKKNVLLKHVFLLSLRTNISNIDGSILQKYYPLWLILKRISCDKTNLMLFNRLRFDFRRRF
jgi:hypothetical protein